MDLDAIYQQVFASQQQYDENVAILFRCKSDLEAQFKKLKDIQVKHEQCLRKISDLQTVKACQSAKKTLQSLTECTSRSIPFIENIPVELATVPTPTAPAPARSPINQDSHIPEPEAVAWQAGHIPTKKYMKNFYGHRTEKLALTSGVKVREFVKLLHSLLTCRYLYY